MIKIPLEEFEKRLGKPLKRNFVSVGIDTATITGIGFITTTNKEVSINWTLLNFEAETTNELYKLMYKELGKVLKDTIDLIVVEDVFLGSNPDVTIKLARFGGLVMAQAMNKQIDFQTISAASSRSKLFKIDMKRYKGRTKDAIKDYLDTIGIPIDENNCADGIVLALLGIIEGMDYRSQADINREQKAQKKKTKKGLTKRSKNAKGVRL